MDTRFLGDLEDCELCEHRCGVNRLSGETGVCRVGLPTVASATLHPAPPQSYTVFMAGCNFKCLNCQNWTISQYPDNGYPQRGYVDPSELAEECIRQLETIPARLMGADRIFFSGGEPTIHLPYLEEVVRRARAIESETKVNFDTNGFMTEKSLERILTFTTSITFDLKVFHEELSQALTGVSSEAVLRNARIVAEQAREKLWEFRILVIPGINEEEVAGLVEFIAEIDGTLPVCFLAFRPNFALAGHPGASRQLMEHCVRVAVKTGLTNAYWSGQAGLGGKILPVDKKIQNRYGAPGAQLAASYARRVGCRTHPRNCSDCSLNQTCEVKKYYPPRAT